MHNELQSTVLHIAGIRDPLITRHSLPSFPPNLCVLLPFSTFSTYSSFFLTLISKPVTKCKLSQSCIGQYTFFWGVWRNKTSWQMDTPSCRKVFIVPNTATQIEEARQRKRERRGWERRALLLAVTCDILTLFVKPWRNKRGRGGPERKERGRRERARERERERELNKVKNLINFFLPLPHPRSGHGGSVYTLFSWTTMGIGTLSFGSATQCSKQQRQLPTQSLTQALGRWGAGEGEGQGHGWNITVVTHLPRERKKKPLKDLPCTLNSLLKNLNVSFNFQMLTFKTILLMFFLKIS